jgi:hypothetical protein
MTINLEFPKQALLIEIPQEEKLLISACDGTGLLGFYHPIPKFNDLSWLNPSKATGITSVSMYGVNEFPYTAWTQQSFLSFGRELDSLCLTQHQIKCFIENGVFNGSSNHFCLNFLSKFDNRYGVVKVIFYRGKYSVNESAWREDSDYGFPGGDSAPNENFIVVPV